MPSFKLNLGEVQTRSQLAEALRVPVDAIGVASLGDGKCKTNNCPLSSLLSNSGRCILCSQTWFPREFGKNGKPAANRRGYGLYGPQFLRGHSSSPPSTCCCDSALCEKIGYSREGMFRLPADPEMREMAVGGLGIRSPELRAKIVASPRNRTVAPWHYHKHQLARVDGRWVRKPESHDRDGKPLYGDGKGNVFSFPIPDADVQWFIDDVVRSRGAVDESLPDWFDVLVRQERDGFENVAPPPDAVGQANISGGEEKITPPGCSVESVAEIEAPRMSLIDSFLRGRFCVSPKEQTESSANGEMVENSVHDGCRKRKRESLSAEIIAGNGAEKALVEDNTTIKIVQFTICREEGCSEFCEVESGLCTGCKARRIERLFNISESAEEAQNQHVKCAATAQAAAANVDARESVEKSQNRQQNQPVVAAMAEAQVVAEEKDTARKQPKFEWRTLWRTQQSRSDAIWQKNFDSYVAHVRRNGAGGDLDRKDNPKLYNWIHRQKTQYRLKSLDESRMKKLREVGFDFNASIWRTCFERLSQYVRENGRLPQSHINVNDTTNRRWWTEQSKRRERGDLSQEQVECMNEIETLLQQIEQKPHQEQYQEEEAEVEYDVASEDDEHNSIDENLNSIEGGTIAGITRTEESGYWESFSRALNSYVHKFGRPPQTREESPALYDWVQLQKERQESLRLLLN